jgi:hypothetical protein
MNGIKIKISKDYPYKMKVHLCCPQCSAGEHHIHNSQQKVKMVHRFTLEDYHLHIIEVFFRQKTIIISVAGLAD